MPRWLCGGGFISGDRAYPTYRSWFKKLTEEGYRVVPYTGKRFFRLGLFGSSWLADALSRQGYPYWIVRLEGHGHDVSECMIYLWDWQKAWLEQNVMSGSGSVKDETLNDPSIPSWWKGDLDDYK